MSRSESPFSVHGLTGIGRISWYMVRVLSLAIASAGRRSHVTLAIELHLCAAPDRASVLVDDDCRRDIMQRRPRAVEDGDLVVAGTPGAAADDDIAELRMNLCSREQAGGQDMLQLADLGTLIEDIDDERRRGGEGRLELLLPLAVRADGGNKHAGRDVGRHHERPTGGRTRHAHVTVTKGATQVLCGLHLQSQTRGSARGHALRAVVVRVEKPRALQGQDRGNRRELELALNATANDSGRSCVASSEELRGDGGGGSGP